VADYTALLARAGFVLRKRSAGRAWIGDVSFDFTNGTARVDMPTVEDTPLYIAGVDRDDQLISLDGVIITGVSRLEEVVQRHRPGDRVRLSIRRRGVLQDLTLTIGEDPTLQLLPVERTGRALTAAERAFRNAWLGSKQ
jgi:predicted metalloprotease with PDZ domain